MTGNMRNCLTINSLIMETKVCKECGKELPIENFRKGRANGTEFTMSICKDCWRKRQKDGKDKAKEKMQIQQIDLVEDAKRKRLSEFTPRELMLELKRRGYEGELSFVEVHKIDLSSID